MPEITLYTTHCPQCIILEKKLNNASIPFYTVEGADEIRKLGYFSAPILKVGSKCLTFKEACSFVDTYFYNK